MSKDLPMTGYEMRFYATAMDLRDIAGYARAQVAKGRQGFGEVIVLCVQAEELMRTAEKVWDRERRKLARVK